jgi:hypothetical protein
MRKVFLQRKGKTFLPIGNLEGSNGGALRCARCTKALCNYLRIKNLALFMNIFNGKILAK